MKFYSITDNLSRRYGKSKANIAFIKFCLKQNKKLIIGTSNQQRTISELREYFPTALFIMIDTWGVKIKIRNKEELIL